jgi:hypothetical protein
MSRCQHAKALARRNEADLVSAYCPDCGLCWSGWRHPWRTLRGRLRQPPRWVLRVCDEAKAKP